MKDKDCIFCKIANGEIPSATIYEDEDFRVILDLGPASRGHALILPKEHFKDVCELDEKVAARVLPLAAKIGAAMKEALGCAGFNLVQNNGSGTDGLSFPCTRDSPLRRRTGNGDLGAGKNGFRGTGRDGSKD